MAKKSNIIWAFDLDGTLADYGGCVSKEVAKKINSLGHVYIITGGLSKQAAKATRLIKSKTIFGMRDEMGNSSIDLSEIFGVQKDEFLKSKTYQTIRKNICIALRMAFHPRIYVGGRSTIDIMPCLDKGEVIESLQLKNKVIYFYDNKWPMNEKIHNDVPAIRVAWKSVHTSPSSIIRDIERCQKKRI